jgi:hypothetical protein
MNFGMARKDCKVLDLWSAGVATIRLDFKSYAKPESEMPAEVDCLEEMVYE